MRDVIHKPILRSCVKLAQNKLYPGTIKQLSNDSCAEITKSLTTVITHYWLYAVLFLFLERYIFCSVLVPIYPRTILHFETTVCSWSVSVIIEYWVNKRPLLFWSLVKRLVLLFGFSSGTAQRNTCSYLSGLKCSLCSIKCKACSIPGLHYSKRCRKHQRLLQKHELC